MLVKVCGLKYDENYTAIRDIGVEWTGINFYEPSKRYIRDNVLPEKQKEIRVGVYVKSTLVDILDSKHLYQIDIAQLHGDEDAEFCKAVQEHMPVIKVFRVDAAFNWDELIDFEFCDYFLFDTKTIEWGGSGKKFEWSILNNYRGDIPFLLSGGIGPGDVEKIKMIDHPRFLGVDINSGFEIEPALKSVEEVSSFYKELKIATSV